jgi:2-desacetyl-2-hydroxyethyl bacteriochlorophyllide A dehydrogenase
MHMKSIQIMGPGECRLVETDVPEPGPGEVLVKVLAVTTCPHWDMHILRGVPMFPGMKIDYPYTIGQPGHEACGDIVAAGPGVDGALVGQRVSVWRDRGHHVPGCYAGYVAVGTADVIPVPESLPPEHCAPLELAMCASAHMLFAEKLDEVRGKRVGVFGLGPAGLVFVQLARAAGAAEVIGFDPVPARRDTGMRVGAARVLDPQSPEMQRIPGRGAEGSLNCSFDCVGIPEAVHQAMALTNRLVVLFAVQREPYIFAPQYWPGLTLAGTQPHTREAAERAAALLASGALNLGAIVSHTMPLSDYARGVEMLEKKQAVKIAFLP